MASSSHASAASRPDSIAASRSSGRSAALRRGGAARPGQLERARPPAVGHLLARADPDPGDDRLPAGDLADRRVGGRGPVEVEQAVQGGDRGRGLALAVDAVQPALRRRRRAANGRGGDQRRPRGRTVAGGGCGAIARGLGLAARAPAPERALRRGGLTGEHDDVRRLARVPAHDVAPVGGPELPGELELDEAEEPRSVRTASRRRRACPAAWTSSEYFDGDVGTVGFWILPRRSMSFAHWPGWRTALSWLPSFGFAPNSGRKPTWMWSLWSGSDSVLSVPGKVISEMI